MSDWAEDELIEVMRIIGAPGTDDDTITYAMKFHAIRMLVEVNTEKYEETLAKVATRTPVDRVTNK